MSQKCTAFDFVVENLNPLFAAHFKILSTAACNFCCITLKTECVYDISRSSTKREEQNHASSEISFAMPLIFKINNVRLMTLPCGTPFSCCFYSGSFPFTLNLNHLSFFNCSIENGNFLLNPARYKSLNTPYRHVKSNAFSKSKNMETVCSPFTNPSLTRNSNLTK